MTNFKSLFHFLINEKKAHFETQFENWFKIKPGWRRVNVCLKIIHIQFEACWEFLGKQVINFTEFMCFSSSTHTHTHTSHMQCMDHKNLTYGSSGPVIGLFLSVCLSLSLHHCLFFVRLFFVRLFLYVFMSLSFICLCPLLYVCLFVIVFFLSFYSRSVFSSLSLLCPSLLCLSFCQLFVCLFFVHPFLSFSIQRCPMSFFFSVTPSNILYFSVCLFVCHFILRSVFLSLSLPDLLSVFLSAFLSYLSSGF